MSLYPWFETLHDTLAQTFEQDYRHEKQVNAWRLAMALFLAAVPGTAVFSGGLLPEYRLGLVAVCVALLYVAVVHLVLRSGTFHPAIKYVSVFVDTTVVSSVLLGFLMAGRGIIATNSQVIFLLYFIVLAMIARRYDVKLAVFGAVLILVEYLLIILVGYLVFHIPEASPDPLYGSFVWPSQVGRSLLLVFAALIMVNTVVNARKLRDQSVRDSLTGTYNRRYFEEVLALQMGQSRQAGKPLTVVMMDVDRFKEYNDRHGHLKGDKVLMAVSDFLLRNLRRNDILARYGGDEFVFVLLETPPDGAGVTLGRLQERMKKWLQESLEEFEPAISLSFGLASLAAEDARPDHLLARADRHLYLAKAAGGGVICDEEGRIIPRDYEATQV